MKKNYDKEIDLILKFTKQEEKLKVLAFYVVLFQNFVMHNLESISNKADFAINFDYNRKLLLDKSENIFFPALEQTLKSSDEKEKIKYIDFHQFAYEYIKSVDQRFLMFSERYVVPFNGYSAEQLIEPVENSMLIGEIDKLKTGFSLKAQLFIFIKNYLEKAIARTSFFNTSRAIIGEVTLALSSEIVGKLREILEQSILPDKTIDYNQLLSSLEVVSSNAISEYINKDSKMIYNFLPVELSGIINAENESEKKLYLQFLCHTIALDEEKDTVSDEVKQAYGAFSDDNLYTFINNIYRFSSSHIPKNEALKKFVEGRTSRKLI